ncbi:hypothetical protein PENTCL1PPCAC_17167, partial [Pristionchus entomophagus]
GIFGAALNIIVIGLIWRKRLSTNMTTYRVGVTVTALQGALLNTLAAISCQVGSSNTLTMRPFIVQVHLFHYDQYAIVMYGPVIVADILLFVFVMAAFGIWELIPSSCILQYLALSKPHYSKLRRLLTAYGVCLGLIVYSIPFFLSFHASPDCSLELTKTVQHVHNLITEDLVRVYGGFLSTKCENDRSVMSLATEGVFPTYLVGYFIFFWSSIRSYRLLNSFGDIRSTRTLELQKKFFTMIILQVDASESIIRNIVLRLVILSLPLGLFGLAIITGMAMDLKTLALSFSLWLVPIVQAIVSLTFVTKMKST